MRERDGDVAQIALRLERDCCKNSRYCTLKLRDWRLLERLLLGIERLFFEVDGLYLDSERLYFEIEFNSFTL